MNFPRAGWIVASPLAIALLVVIVWFRPLQPDDNSPAFLIATTKETHWVPPDQVVHLPRFDTTNNHWLLGKRQISNLPENMLDNWEGPNAFVRSYFVFTLV
jgi:hypothetical protein